MGTVRVVPEPVTVPTVMPVEGLKVTVAPETKFAGMTLGEFKVATDPCRDLREGLAASASSRKAAVGTRNYADKVSRALVKRVIAGVKADPAFGDDCALYRAMGFVPASERKHAVRKAKATTPQS